MQGVCSGGAVHVSTFEKANILRACLAELEESSKVKAPKVGAKRKTADTEVAA